MSDRLSVLLLVAWFLKQNGYSKSLEAFVAETDLPVEFLGSDSDPARPETEDATETNANTKTDPVLNCNLDIAGTTRVSSLRTPSFTLEQLVREKGLFDLSVRFEKGAKLDGDGDDDDANKKAGWGTGAPVRPFLAPVSGSSNVLSLSLLHKQPSALSNQTAHSSQSLESDVLYFSTADRSLHSFEVDAKLLHEWPAPGEKSAPSRLSHSLRGNTLKPLGSPILSHVCLPGGYVVCGSMGGRVCVCDSDNGEKVDERRDHGKHVVRIAHVRVDLSQTTGGERVTRRGGGDVSGGQDGVSPGTTCDIVATAAWDRTVLLYQIDWTSGSGKPVLGQPVGKIETATNPEDVVFAWRSGGGNRGLDDDCRTEVPWLTVARQDSAELHYYNLGAVLPVKGERRHAYETENGDSNLPDPVMIPLAGRQSLSPHSTGWVPFGLSSIALCPTDGGKIGVATSSGPFLKVIVARLVFPRECGEAAAAAAGASRGPVPTENGSAVVATGTDLAAILLSVTTPVGQTAYSTPVLVWRPDGSGVWVTGDDGVVWGIDARTGEVAAELKGGHRDGVRVRCLWAGTVRKDSDDLEARDEGEEVLLSGGFDGRVVVWSR